MLNQYDNDFSCCEEIHIKLIIQLLWSSFIPKFPLIIDETSVIPSQLPGACVQVWKLGPIPIITIQSRLIPPPLSSASLQILSQIFKRQRSLPKLGAESNDKWSRELNFINVRNYYQRSLNRYWHSPSATFRVRQSKPKNCQFMKNRRYHRMNRSWSKLGMKLSFTSCPKIPMTKKVSDLRPHLSRFPTHESIVYLRKGFIKYLLKYVKQFLWAGFYQGLRGVLSPWLLSTVNSHEIKLLESISIILIVKIIKRVSPIIWISWKLSIPIKGK